MHARHRQEWRGESQEWRTRLLSECTKKAVPEPPGTARRSTRASDDGLSGEREIAGVARMVDARHQGRTRAAVGGTTLAGPDGFTHGAAPLRFRLSGRDGPPTANR